MKPSITPELVDRFRAYMKRDPALFHVVLEDNNTEDHFAKGTLDEARERGDQEAVELAEILVAMSRTQRRKLAARLWDATNEAEMNRRVAHNCGDEARPASRRPWDDRGWTPS